VHYNKIRMKNVYDILVSYISYIFKFLQTGLETKSRKNDTTYQLYVYGVHLM
jgi:hypothetical protein